MALAALAGEESFAQLASLAIPVQIHAWTLVEGAPELFATNQILTTSTGTSAS